MEYDIICSESIDKLVEYVNVYQGGIGVLTQGLSYKVFYQAVVKGKSNDQ